MLTLLLLWIVAGPSDPIRPTRVISLAPSLTELVCVVGGESSLVGVTSFCTYPPSVRQPTLVGGYLDPNLETIVSLRPELILSLPEHQATNEKLRTLGLRVEVIKNWSLADIHESVAQIGALLARQDEAATLGAQLMATQTRLTRSSSKRPRVLLILGQMGEEEPSSTFYVVGRNGFLNEVLELAGGQNAWDKEKPYFPSITQEVLLGLNPDWIIELVPRADLSEAERKKRKTFWSNMPFLKARHGHIEIIAQDHVLQAGPRYLATLEILYRLLGTP